MKVQVEGNLYILSDERQFVIAELRTRPKKDTDETEEYFYNLGYYSSLKGVITALITRKLKDSTAVTLNELLVDVKKIKNDIESMVYV